MITDLNKNKKKSYEVLNEFLNELHKLKYKDFFLSGGSLLGLIRNSNILISDDIDFCTKEEVLLKKIDVIANKLKKKKFKVEKKLDVARLHCYKKNVKISLASYRLKNNVRVSRFCKLPKIIFKDKKHISLKKIIIPIPKNSNKYLNFVYDNWKVRNQGRFFYNYQYFRNDSFFYKLLLLKRFISILENKIGVTRFFSWHD